MNQQQPWDQQGQYGPRPGDEKLFVKFYMGAVLNDGKSREAGHPVYDDVPFVIIRAPGDKNTVIDTKVDDSHKFRFPRQWQQFSASEEQTVSGWQLRQWPAITRGQAEELVQLGVVTVEQLASMADSFGQRIMGFAELKKKAVAALETAKNGADAQRLSVENKELRGTIDAMQKQMEAMQGQVAGLLAGQAATTAPQGKNR